MAEAAAARVLVKGIALAWEACDERMKRCIAAASLCAVAAALTSAAVPLALKALVDQFTQPGEGPSPLYAWLVAAYVGGYWVARALNELRALALAWIEHRLNRRLSSHLMRHLLALPLGFHLSRTTGGICETLASGQQAYQVLLSHSTATLLPVLVELGAVLLIMMHLGETSLFLALALGMAAYAIVFVFGMVRLVKPARAALAAKTRAQGILADSLLNYESVKYCSAESAVTGRYDSSLGVAQAHWGSFFGIKVRNGIACGTVFCALLGGTLLYAASRVEQGTLSVGDLVLINAYLFQVVRPLELLGLVLQDLIRSAAVIERLLALLAEPRETEGDCSHAVATASQSGLAFEHVDFGYGCRRLVLRDLSFVAPRGSVTAIVGASGAGKSSIGRLIFRFFDPARGRITLDGVPLPSLPLAELRRTVAIVPQDIVLFDDTLAYNIALGSTDAATADIMRVVQMACLQGTLARMPNGLDALVGERGLKLSGGERQRVALARALLRGAQILVFDEATASVDGETEADILRNLRAGLAGCTIIMIAHRLSTVMHADQILVLEHGCIREHGTHKELLRRSGRYARAWRQQHTSAVPDFPISATHPH